ncbi:nuclear transport factor 2 family protein [Pseudomarimonas salicorniae]|uniref:Nuclear transport factor 2 family protein n=1 Tax=Pseudomarimonas salicorniae TaxID=2933270 RepID=A0ABT0GJ94_9GAMM|nr:nuclear transport factor 2 family protein [Lysobacter sp. CAU 1642]MCK7594422.1 nuclear transport factor 2 family protein [Lysobacter sp. CAU 1642]
MPHPNAILLERFYTAFRDLDAPAMAACYTEDASFEDPVFSLHGAGEIAAMWTMLCEAVKDKGRDAWRLEFSAIEADDFHGSAHWEPHYRFSATGRMVHNVIDACFVFDGGRIQHHHDSFSFWRWSRQALGAPGWLLGWTPLLRGKVRQQAARNLQRFRASG